MRSYVVLLIFLGMCFTLISGRQAEAYSVTMQEDSMYAEIVPSNIRKNTVPMFKKQVQKAMKYYDKYKNADAYTYLEKVPDKYRDFIEVVKKIQDTDEIVIRYPFYIYYVSSEGGWYRYYFLAERNGEKLCIFRIDVDEGNGETELSYDKMLDCYTLLGENLKEDTLFYQIGGAIYAETPDQIKVLKKDPMDGMQQMEGGEDAARESKEFYRKKYEEKKNIMFDYLEGVKNGKVIKKSEKKLESELEDEYIEPESSADRKGYAKGLLMTIYVGGLFILAIAVVLFLKNRSTEK